MDVWRHGLARLPDSERARNTVLPEHAIREIVAAAHDIGREFGLFVEIAATTGARTSQVLRLTAGDLLDDDRVMMPSSKKGKRRRIERRALPLSPSLAAKLRMLAAGKPTDAPLLAVAYPDRIFRALAKRLGLDGSVTLYAMRHSSIVRMLLAGVPTRVVAAAHDTSVLMIEQNYARYIGDHTEGLLRGVLLDVASSAPANNVVSLVKG